MRCCLVLAALPGLAAPTFAQARAELVPASRLRPLEAIATKLAAIGKEAEAKEILASLRDLGHSDKALNRLTKKIAKTKVDRRKASRALPRIVKDIARVAIALDGRIEKLEPGQRDAVARCLAKLHGPLPKTRAALDHQQVDGRWLSVEDIARRERRIAIGDAVRRARQLTFDIKAEQCKHDALDCAYGRTGVTLSWKQVKVSSALSETKTRRILGNVLRCSALANWLVTGELQPPPTAQFSAIMLDSQPKYYKVIDARLAAKRISAAEARVGRQTSTMIAANGEIVFFSYTESYAIAGLFCYATGIVSDLYGRDLQLPALLAGLGNWTLQACYGTPIPAVTWSPSSAKTGGVGTTARRDTDEPSREELELMAGAGLMGCRSWLRYLAARGEDPPWSRSMVNTIGKVDQENLLKSTLVIEYLIEKGKLQPLFEATREAAGKTASAAVASIERALGRPMHEFETAWRRWLLGGNQPLTERLQAAPTGVLSEDERQVLAQMAKIRTAAFRHRSLLNLPAVGLDRQLSQGAVRHAKYLNRHPAQITKWPDAHEEYSDRELFSPAGAWAGMHSVISPGTRTVKAAIDGWMGTFYHRMPLIAPGLLRVGWGLDKTTAVLDTNSIVREFKSEWHVAWPHDGMRNVPVSFQPELPNPVPGEDQSKWGYPITLEVMPSSEGVAAEISMSLHLDSERGASIDCHVSTPSSSANPHMAPERTFCLIPKTRLKKGAKYFVVATWVRSGKKLTWTFRT